MRLDVYVNYRGTCEQAFRFYRQHLGGRITGIVRHGEQPNANAPAEWRDKVLHARIEIGSTVRFAMLRDRFGTSWMLLHQPEAP